MTPVTLDALRLGELIEVTLSAMPPTPWLPSPESCAVKLLADGVYHANFTVESDAQKSVARVNRRSQWGLSHRDQLTREFAVLRDLRAAGVAPTPLAFVDTESITFIVESLIEGRYVKYNDDLEACAIAFAAAHTCPPHESAALLDDKPAQSFLLEDGLRWLDQIPGPYRDSHSRAVLKDAAGRLRQRDLPENGAALLHTDLIHHNLLLSEGHCTIVDWEGARIGSPEWDLAYFLSPVTLGWAHPPATVDDADRERFIETYSSAARIDPGSLDAQIRAITPLVVFRALAWCLGYRAQEPSESREVMERLALFTSPEFILETLAKVELQQ